jgi:hypothetical protein
MLNNYLRYDVYKALRSGVVNRGSYERYALNNGVIAELYAFFDIVREENCIGSGVSHTSAVLQVLRKSKPFLKVYNNIGPRYIASVADRDPEAFEEFRTLLKEATHTSDDCIISLQGELKELKNNYGVLADSNSNSRYSTIIRNAYTGLAYLVSVGWPEDL